jgi:putative spermidine/putrescine transport system ATP-binding protein
VEFVSYLGATIEVRVRLSSQERVLVQVPSSGANPPRAGQGVHVAWPAASGIVFASAGEQTVAAF